jgi:hypothetical protein
MESILMVGDSLLLKTWESLTDVLQRMGGRQTKLKMELDDCRASHKNHRHRARKPSCGPCCCRTFTLPCPGPAGAAPIRVRFARHNHLLGDFLPHAGKFCPQCQQCPACAACTACRHVLGARTLCNAWREKAVLGNTTTLIVGTGSHVLEVPSYNESGVFARRADELAALLAASHPYRVLFLLSSWGEQDFRPEFRGPNEPEPPRATYAWDLIPSVNAEYARAMRARGFLVVDPTLALQGRKDCRIDYMHSKPGVYAQSTWRLLQHALASLSVP